MKLTKSKKFLADAIHASEKGWQDGSDFAVQDKDMWICLYEGKPTRHGDAWQDDGDCLYKLGFAHDKLSPNWHQTCLSREEYFSAYPAEPVADADGWIEWKCGECPVGIDEVVDVMQLDGHTYTAMAVNFHWRLKNGSVSVARYRPHKQVDKSTAVGDDETNLAAKEELDALEFCESVKRSIPEPEAKPTIEQLAADYRNAKDYANRKQQEADDAKAVVDAALGELRISARELGMVAIADIMPAICGCMRLADAIPTRLQNHGDESVAAIGDIINTEGLYHKIRDAFDLIK